MFRRTDIIMIAGAVAMAGYTYAIKSDTKQKRQTLAAVQEEIASEENAIQILRADWSLLTSPQRIQSLVGVYADQLNLTPADARREVAIEDIPMRPAPVVPEMDIDQLLARIASSNPDAMTTGSIGETPFVRPILSEEEINEVIEE